MGADDCLCLASCVLHGTIESGLSYGWHACLGDEKCVDIVRLRGVVHGAGESAVPQEDSKMSERVNRFRALVKKELLATLKEKTSRLILVGPLLLYILLFGYIASFNLDRVPYALCDLSKTSSSETFVRALDNNRIFDRIATLENASQATMAIDELNALVVVVIEDQFNEHLKNGEMAAVQVIIDGRNSTTAQLAAGYVSSIAQSINEKNAIASPLSIRVLFNPNAITQWFIMPGLIVMLSMLQVMILSALSVAREREQGTFEQLLVSPYSTTELLCAKALVPIAVGLFQGTLILLVDLFWFNIPMAGSLVSLYVVLTGFTVSIVGVGLAISAYSQTMQQGLILTFVLLVPMVLLSGLFAPVQNMPDWLQLLTYADPLRFALAGIRRIYLAGASLSEVLVMMWPVWVMAIIGLPTAYHYFKRRL